MPRNLPIPARRTWQWTQRQMDKLMAFLHKRRLAVVGGTVLGFVLLFPGLYRVFGDGVVTFSLLPVLLAGWLYGLRVGLGFGLGAFLVSLLLASLVSKQPIGLL